MGGGGYSETLRLGLSDNFHFQGGYSETVFQNRGSTTPAGSCITDSLSHTTYVETNNLDMEFRDRLQTLGDVHMFRLRLRFFLSEQSILRMLI